MRNHYTLETNTPRGTLVFETRVASTGHRTTTKQVFPNLRLIYVLIGDPKQGILQPPEHITLWFFYDPDHSKSRRRARVLRHCSDDFRSQPLPSSRLRQITL